MKMSFAFAPGKTSTRLSMNAATAFLLNFCCFCFWEKGTFQHFPSHIMSSNPPPPPPPDGGGRNNGWNQYYQNSAQQKPGSYSSPFVPAASQASASDPQSSYYYGAAGGSAGVNPYGRTHASNPYAGVYAAPAASYAQPSQNPYYAQASYSSSPINYASSGPAHQSSPSAYTSPWQVSPNRPVQHAASSNVANYWASMGYPSGSQPQVQSQVQSQGQSQAQSQGQYQSASAVSSNLAPWKSAGQSKMSFAEIVKQKKVSIHLSSSSVL